MPKAITVDEAQANLKGLIASLAPGEEIVLTDHDQPVAKLVAGPPARAPRPKPGLGKGSILYMAPDFDDLPEEFREYVE